MTRRQISRRAFDPHHKKLMLAVRHAPKGLKRSRIEALKAHVTRLLGK